MQMLPSPIGYKIINAAASYTGRLIVRSHNTMSPLSYALFDTFLGGSVKITSPYKGYPKKVKVLVDLNNSSSTVLSGTMRYVGGDKIEHPIFG